MFEFPRRIHVAAEQSLFKLSQDIDAERRGRVQDEFRAARGARWPS